MATVATRVRVAFLLHTLSRSGGLEIVLGHARRLRAHGIEADIVLTASGPDPALPELPDLEVLSQSVAATRAYDIAIATWWETAEALFEVPARRRALFLQGVEQLYYRDDAPFEQLAAALPLLLPIHYVAVSHGLVRALAALRPDAPCHLVRNGVDKAVFRPRERSPRPPVGALRVLVEGQPSLWFKGTEDAVAAVAAMRRPASVTLVAHDQAARQWEGLPVSRFVGGLDPAEMADMYAEHDVVLKLSRHEGLGMVPIEAFHAGVPAILTPYAGAADYLVHGENGVLVDFDDLPGTTAWLDRLAVDRELLERLSDGALVTARRWPSIDEATTAMAEALTAIAAADAPDPDLALSQLMRSVRLHAELGRQKLVNLRWTIEARERELRQQRERPAVKLARAARRALQRS
jgi:glycosyltransferase involved in cell wall biosynthesis